MGHRLKLEEVACEIAPARTRARVQLRNAGLEHVGLASSRADEGNWQQVVAQATVNAVRMYAGFAGADMRTALTVADRKSTRLNSSHSQISYAVFCLKKKKKYIRIYHNE